MKSLFHFFKKPSFKVWSLAAFTGLPLLAAPKFETQKDLFKHIETKRNFTFDIDQDFNSFPDTFSMEKGKGFQTYHSIRIDKEGVDDDKSLKFLFSGGKAGVNSYPIILDPRYAYNLQLSYKGNSLGERYSNELEFGLKAYDDKNNLLEGIPKMVEKTFSSDWQKSRILRIERLPEKTKSCVLYINLAGRPSGKSELWIDQIEIVASPRIQFETGKDLNIYDFEDEINYTVSIDGTDPGEPYQLDLEITDFLGNSIDKQSYPFNGSLDTQVFGEPLLQSSSGVYNLNAKLMYGGKTLINLKEIMARNTPAKDQISNDAFGVLLGHPQVPFDSLILSLQKLGTKISKLSLLPEDFLLKSSLSNDGSSLTSLDNLLLEKAPDDGYQFIASMDIIPTDTIGDKYNPPKNVLETMSNHPEPWKKVFDRLIFLYGNVLTDWQLGSDRKTFNEEDLETIKELTDHLKTKTNWMDILYPSRQPATKNGFQSNFYISKDMSLKDIEDQLKANPWNKLVATLELHSNHDEDGLFVIEDMVKKICFLMAQKNANGDPLVKRLFIDSLTDDRGAGLMNEKYEPQSTYFAAKTMIHWTYGAEYIGSFQHPDKDIVNYAFKRGNQAFAIFWNNSTKNTPKEYSLGAGVEWMDLMGNKRYLVKGNDNSVLLPLSKTPGFVMSPNPKLWETMLSLKLTQSPLKSKVELQKQVATLQNYFDEQANFEVEIIYPDGWTVNTRKFEAMLDPKDRASFELSLSPSAQSPVNTAIPVYTHIDINFKNNNHSVKAYREEILLSDVKMDMSFFEEGDNLEMVIEVALSDDASKSSSFIASALMPNGETFEAFFRNIQPGQNNSKRIFVLDGKDMVGKNVNLSVKENIGQRYLNADFAIKTSF